MMHASETSTVSTGRFSSLGNRVLPLVLLAVVTILAYTNAAPDNLVFDDKYFVGPAPAAAHDSLQSMFANDVWHKFDLQTGIYRPLLLVNLSLENSLFKNWLPGYHLSNILQHLLASWLVFGFLGFLLRQSEVPARLSTLCALLASMVFAVHPVHAEVVNSAFNRSETMVTLLAVGGLWWLLANLDRQPGRAWAGLGLLYFLGLLCRESAVTIPALAVLLVLLIGQGSLRDRLRKSVPVFWLLIPLGLYIVMRLAALSTTGSDSATPDRVGPEVAFTLNGIPMPGSRILTQVVGMYGQALSVVMWPHPLRIFYPDPSRLMVAVYAVLNGALIVLALILLRKGRQGLALGLGFFYIALLPASRIINLDGTGALLSDRNLYFPSVGLAIVLAFALAALARRTSPRLPLFLVMPIVLVLAVLTWERNADWGSEITLFEAEYRAGDPDVNALRLLTSVHQNRKNWDRIIAICDREVEMQEANGDSVFTRTCATTYERRNRLAEAERAWQYATGFKKTRVTASKALGHFYLRHGRPNEADQQYLAAIEWSDDPAEKALNQADRLLRMYPGDTDAAVKAGEYLEEALRYRPDWVNAKRMLRRVEKILDAAVEPKEDGSE